MSSEARKSLKQKYAGDDTATIEWNVFKDLIADVFSNYTEMMKSEHLDLPSTLFEMNSEEQRVEFLTKDRRVIETAMTFVQNFVERKRDKKKDEKMANDLSEKGHKRFDEKNYVETLQHFSEALDYMPIESEGFKILLLNRSQVLLKLHRYEEALIDIDRLLKIGFDRKETESLFAKKIRCMKGMKMDKEASEVPDEMAAYFRDTVDDNSLNRMKASLSTVLNENISMASKLTLRKYNTDMDTPNNLLMHASDAVQIKYTSNKERYVAAKRDIKPSEVLFSEEPLEVWLRPSLYKKFCFYCLKRLKSHIPCRGCSVVRYCNEICENDSWNRHHSKECRYIDILVYLSYAFVVFRIILKLGTKRMIDMSEEVGKAKFNVYKGDINSLCALHHNFNKNIVYTKTLEAIVLCLFLTRINYLEDNLNQKELNIYAGNVSKLLLICSYHRRKIFSDPSNSLYCMCIPQVQENADFVGIGIYPSVSLMNYGCGNPTYDVYCGSKVIVKASFALQKGEEVRNGYIYTRDYSLKDRQTAIRNRFYYDCGCRRCSDKKENIHLAFRCRYCNGALIVNLDKSNSCLDCGQTENKVKSFRSQTETLVSQFKTAISEKDHKEKKVLLLTCRKNFEEFFYSKHYLMASVLYEIGNCYFTEKNFKAAKEHYQAAYDIRNEIYGQDCYETLMCAVRIAAVILNDWMGIKDENEKRRKEAEVQQTFIQCKRVYERLLKSEFATLTSPTESVIVKQMLEEYFKNN